MQVSTLVQANITSLMSIKRMLLAINDQQYRAVVAPFTASLGKHLRHVIEHYQLLLDGLDDGYIDYDDRLRGEIDESERSSMIMRIQRVCQALHEIPSRYSGDEMIMISTAVDQASEVPKVSSGLNRELVFLQSHSVHHYAIISAILKLQNVDVDADFGVATSTLIHEKNQKCAP